MANKYGINTKSREDMNVKQLREALAAYPDNMDVTISEGVAVTCSEGELQLEPYVDYNLLVITFKDEE